jgi:hypothetical protein
VVIVAPFLGTLIYLIFRRPGATPEERQAIDTTSREFVSRYAPDSRTSQLQVVADLHDRGCSAHRHPRRPDGGHVGITKIDSERAFSFNHRKLRWREVPQLPLNHHFSSHID